MIDRRALLATLKPQVVALEASISQRVAETPTVDAALTAEYDRAFAAGRTAMGADEWRAGEVTQAAVAWVLAGVFVRFLEDNGLIDAPLIAGPGDRRAAALGHREEHFRRAPADSDREYLEACFREVARFPAVAPLYDERHNPLWRFGPTADGARALRETLAAIDPASGELEHDYRDPDLGTRFLGDLYQDLSEAAKKRYALLQTPDFVERFILDRTLTPALGEFALDEVHLIDPTCGSGHFLIGAFERLFALWQEREPATDAAVLAQRCLDHVAGVDLNPFATAIARFRLVVAALRACGIRRLAEAPDFRLQLATGDSLLHGPLPADGAAMLFDANRLDKNITHYFATEDAGDLKRILGRGYHAVVGNPPYIAGDDTAQRDAYRVRYPSSRGLFTANVPFMERFFELAQVRGESGSSRPGFVGKITGNNFMKREFGAPLVEGFLRSVDLRTIIDTSGAYIPGHGTPTLILFGRPRSPSTEVLRVVDGLRGEPGPPEDPSQGFVWRSIIDLMDRPGEESAFVRSSDVDRRELLSHPMLLGAGRDLKRSLETDAQRLRECVHAIGRIAASSADDVLTRPSAGWRRPTAHLATSVEGGTVRHWAIDASDRCVFPYTVDGLVDLDETETRVLWRHKTTLWERRTFSKQSYREEGRAWWAWHQVALERLRTDMALSWGEVATHNHFVLDRGGKVFKQTAPVIKLPAGATEAEHLALLGVLNSSVACFWLKQVAMNKGGGGINEGHRGDAWEFFFQFAATKIKNLPLPKQRSSELATTIDAKAGERVALLDDLTPADGGLLADHLATLRDRDERLTNELIAFQEELDWEVLAAYGLVPGDLPVLGAQAPPIALGERAFELVLARSGEETTWFERHGSTAITELPADWPAAYRDVVERRIAVIESDPDVGLIERPEHKRRWDRTPWEDRQRDALTALVLDALEAPGLWADFRPQSTAELTDHLRRTPLLVEALELLAEPRDRDVAGTVRLLVLGAAVPRLAAQRFKPGGLKKHAVWQRVWELQRAEDRGEVVDPIPVPPKYGKGDFRDDVSWKHRGKLDVPKERFTLIPSAERGADQTPVVGWAGWDERDLARALAGRIIELADQHAADAATLTPLLATVLELLPWVHQWHPDADPAFGGPPGAYFETWLDGQLAALGVTRDALRDWRP